MEKLSQIILESTLEKNNVNFSLYEKNLQEIENDLIKKEIPIKKQEQILQDFLSFLVENDNEDIITNKKKEILSLETNYKIKTLQNQIEIPPTYGKSYVEYLQEYPATLQKIESYLQQPETIITWSEKIENLWWEFAIGAFSPQLQEKIGQEPALLQNIKTGLSLYFTNWLNKLSDSQLKQVSQVGNGIDWILSKASDLMWIFKNLTSFKEQMDAITTLTQGMDLYAIELIGEQNISQLAWFQSPEGFMTLLQKHTLKPGEKRNKDIVSFEHYFDIQDISPIEGSSIIKDLEESYTDNAHNLMTQVNKLWPKVLESRSSLKKTFGAVYDQISQVMSIFSNWKSLSEIIEGSVFATPLNFIARLIGIGTIKDYESRLKLKDLTQKHPKSQKEWLLQSIDYVNSHPNEKTTQEFMKRFDIITPTIYTQYNITKEMVIDELPNINILKQWINRALLMDHSFYIHPQYLQQAGIKNYKQYYTTDKQWNNIINPNTIKEYQSTIKENLDQICDMVWLSDSWSLQPEHIISLVSSGRKKEHITNYLLSSLSFPDNASDMIDTNKNTIKTTKQQPTETTTEILSWWNITKETTEYNLIVNEVINKIEWWYYHPNMNIGVMWISWETMFGIDRKHGGSLNTSEYWKKFRSIIDQDKKENPQKWKHNYRWWSKEWELMQLAGNIIKPHYEKLVTTYLSPKAQDIIKTDWRLLFNFIYGARNWAWWFQKFAKVINKDIEKWITNPDILYENILQYRKNKSGNKLIARSWKKIEDIFT